MADACDVEAVEALRLGPLVATPPRRAVCLGMADAGDAVVIGEPRLGPLAAVPPRLAVCFARGLFGVGSSGFAGAGLALFAAGWLVEGFFRGVDFSGSAFLFAPPVVLALLGGALLAAAGVMAVFLASLSLLVHAVLSFFSNLEMWSGTARSVPLTASSRRIRATDFVFDGLRP